ncbi:MAG: hypothetical protein R3F23_01950 [Verrucomicrobiia bacterium]
MASLRQGKLIRTIEVDSYDPKVHGKPFTLTLTQDPKNPYRYRSQTLRIEKFENLNIKIDGQRISFIPKNYVAENVDPALSSDRFHVQIYDPSLSTDKPVRAKLKTQSANSNQTKDSTTVFLYPVEGQPGLYRSASLMLTSYPEVDQYAAHGIADKKPGDPTVLAMPGDRVSISYGKKTVSAEVPIKKVLPVKFYVYKDNNGQPVTDQKWADKQITQLQKDLAPYGILVKAEPTVILDHPLHIDTSKKLTLAQQTLLTGITANNDPDFQGLRFVPVGDYTVDLEETAVGRAFVNNNSNTSFIVHNANKHTITHEVVHHLTYNKQTGRSPTNHDNQGHVTSPKDSVVQNLMEDNSDGKSPHSVGNHVISLTQDQIDAILANPILQDLPQPTQTIQQTPAPTP